MQQVILEMEDDDAKKWNEASPAKRSQLIAYIKDFLRLEENSMVSEPAISYLTLSEKKTGHPFNNIQAELLKVFSVGIPDSDLVELKKIMAKFFLEKAQNKVDKIWDERGYTEEKLQQMLKD